MAYPKKDAVSDLVRAHGYVPFPQTALAVWLYCYRDATGAPLYIGQTEGLAGRHADHRRLSPWFPDVADFEVLSVHFDRRAALDAEAAAIRALAPRHNVIHNLGRGVAA